MIVADCHVHIYPFFSAEKLLSLFESRVHFLFEKKELLPEAAFLLLTERQDCHFFSDMKSGSLRLSDVCVEPCEDEDAIVLKGNAGIPLVLIAGRQIISEERVEVLALGRDLDIQDGFALRETLEQVLDADAVPCLPWSPGKWLSARGKLVRDSLQQFSARELLLGDIAMRPKLMPCPAIMNDGLRRGFRVICGSDPLPVKGEENMIASYMSAFEAEFDSSEPARFMRALLRNGEPQALPAFGGQSSLWQFFSRQLRNKFCR